MQSSLGMMVGAMWEKQLVENLMDMANTTHLLLGLELIISCSTMVSGCRHGTLFVQDAHVASVSACQLLGTCLLDWLAHA